MNERALAVTKNLANALRYIGGNLNVLVPGVQYVWLWVDAICINQNDIEEKNSQVKLMDLIYNRASLVISWLGLDVDGRPLAIERVKALARRLNNAIEREEFEDPSWLEEHVEFTDAETFRTFRRDLRKILDHDYWGRVWIVQEVTLAWHVAIMSGAEIMADKDLVLVLRWLHIIQAKQPAKPPRVDRMAWDSLTDSMTFSFIDLQLHFRLGAKDLRERGIHLLCDAVRLQATNPRDKIYGLQGICPMGLIVDYGKDVREVYVDIAKKFVSSNFIFELVSRAGIGLQPVPNNPFDLPSWVPDWHTLSVGKAWNLYQAAAFTSKPGLAEDRVQLPLSAPELTANNHLMLHGIRFDSIEAIGPDFGGPDGSLSSIALFCSSYARMDQCFDRGPTQYPTKIPRLQVSFRMILTGIFQHQERDILELCQEFLCLLANVDTPFPVNHGERPEWSTERIERLSALTGLRVDERFSESLQEMVLGSAASCPDEWRNLTAIDALNKGRQSSQKLHWSIVETCFRIIMYRRVFFTSTGYLGIGPPGICDEDIVVKLSGVPWTAVLRRKDPCYQLVGLCYIVDLVSSEFWNASRANGHCPESLEKFELC